MKKDRLGPKRCQASIAVFLVLALNQFVHAETTQLSPKYRKVLERSSGFHQLLSVSELPPSIVTLCADMNNKLADPGQEWQATDVILGKVLPWNRLIWAFHHGDLYVVHYEHGGVGHSFHVLLATSTNSDEPKVLWHHSGMMLFKDYETFRESLKKNKPCEFHNLEHGFRIASCYEISHGFEGRRHYRDLYYHSKHIANDIEFYYISPSGRFVLFGQRGHLLLATPQKGSLQDVTNPPFAIPKGVEWRENESKAIVFYYDGKKPEEVKITGQVQMKSAKKR